MFETIVNFFKALFEAIPVIGRWLHKTEEEKVEKEIILIQDKMKKFKETGRPE